MSIHAERSDACNWSTLKFILRSPKHYLHALAHPRADTEALLRGRALHTICYEPQEWPRRYSIMPNFHGGMLDATAKEKGYAGGKEAKAKWLSENRGVEILEPEVYASVVGMNDALKSDPIAAGYVVGGKAEQLVTWTDAETGIECRGRVDHYNGSLSDLKSCANIEPRAVSRQIGTLGYHAQLAFYADGLEANEITLVEPPALIFVEAVAPYDVAVYEFTHEDVAAGRAVYRRALSILSDCRRTGLWPGVAGGVRQRVSIPAWASVDDDVEITMGGERLF